MGREGVAFMFVSPDEGSELTKIEQRINRELIRDDIEGITGMTPPSESTTSAQPKREPPAEMLRRPPKRYRRAL